MDRSISGNVAQTGPRLPGGYDTSYVDVQRRGCLDELLSLVRATPPAPDRPWMYGPSELAEAYEQITRGQGVDIKTPAVAVARTMRRGTAAAGCEASRGNMGSCRLMPDCAADQRFCVLSRDA